MSSTLNRDYTSQVQANLKMESIGIRDYWFKKAGASPFVSMLKAKGRAVNETNQEFKWAETRPNKILFNISAATAAATKLTVDTTEATAGFLAENSIIRVKKTGEQMLVTAVNGKEITVVRGYGPIAAAEISEDAASSGKAAVINLSRAFPEGSKAPGGTVVIRSLNENYSQTFRNSLVITRNDLKTRRYDYDDDGAGKVGERRKERRQQIFKLHQRDIETQLLFGQPKADLSGDMPRYVTGGLTHFIQTNVLSITSASDFSTDTINAVMASMSDAGAAGDKVLMAGSEFMKALDSNAVKVFGGGGGAEIRKFGLGVKTALTNFGNLDVVYNPILSSINPRMGIFIDMDNVKLHNIEDTTIHTNITVQGDYDGIKDTIITDCGLEVSNEECHAIVTLDW